MESWEREREREREREPVRTGEFWVRVTTVDHLTIH